MLRLTSRDSRWNCLTNNAVIAHLECPGDLLTQSLLLLLEQVVHRRRQLSIYTVPHCLSWGDVEFTSIDLHAGSGPSQEGHGHGGWWDSFAFNVVPSQEWKDNFRLSTHTFYFLCKQMGPYVEGQPARMRDPVEVESQVALSLYYLADEGSIRRTANSFGLSHSSVSIIVRKECRAICEHLGA